MIDIELQATILGFDPQNAERYEERESPTNSRIAKVVRFPCGCQIREVGYGKDRVQYYRHCRKHQRIAIVWKERKA